MKLAFDLINQEVFVLAIHDIVLDLKVYSKIEKKNNRMNCFFLFLPGPFSQYSSGREHSVGYIERVINSLESKEEEETDRHNIVHLMDIEHQILGLDNLLEQRLEHCY